MQTVIMDTSSQNLDVIANSLDLQPIEDNKKAVQDNIVDDFEYARGNMISENYEFTISWMRSEIKYSYDVNNRLIEKTYTSNESGYIKTESYYDYHSNGALLGEKKLKNEVLTDEINYLYDEGFNLTKSEVNRDHINSSIGIVKFDYTYYN